MRVLSWRNDELTFDYESAVKIVINTVTTALISYSFAWALMYYCVCVNYLAMYSTYRTSAINIMSIVVFFILTRYDPYEEK